MEDNVETFEECGEFEGETVLRFSEDGKKSWIEKTAKLFKAGTQKGRPYTESDLDGIVARFREPSGEQDWSVPVQTDHSDRAWDTVGNVRKAWRAGEWLMGKLRFTLDEAVRRVEAGTFRKLSVGLRLLPNMELREVTVTPFPHVADAQVFSEGGNTVDEKDKKIKELQDKCDALMAECDTMKKKMAKMTEEAPTEKKPEESPEIAKMREEFRAEVATLKDEIAKGKEEAHFSECKSLVESFVASAKTAPAVSEKELDFAKTLSEEQFEAFKELKAKSPVYVEFVRKSAPGLKAPGNFDQGKNVQQEVTALMSETGYVKDEKTGKMVKMA